MGKYQLERVTLGEAQGQGYAFKRRTAFGKARKGIFFPDSDEDLDLLEEGGQYTFTGSCYYRQRGPRDREFDVVISNITSTRMGHRIDFEAIDNPEPVLTVEVAEEEE